jgi:DHA1 family multidrug resistance protein-like MFS transporter
MESVFLIGVLTSLPSIVPILLDIPAGNLVQRSGEKIVIFLGFIAALFPPIMYYASVVPLFFFGKAMEGVGKALIWNGGWSLTLKSSDSDVESESISVFLLGINLSIVIGPVIGGFLLSSYGFSLLFGLWAASWLFSIVLYYFYIGTEREGEGLKQSLKDLERRKTYFDDWIHLKENWSDLRKVFSLVFLYSIIFSFYWLAIPLMLDKMNAEFSTMGIIFGVAALPKVFQFVFGDIADRIGNNKTISILTFLLIPTLFAMSLTESLLVTGVLFFLARIFSEGLSPAIHSKFDAATPDEVEGEMTGFNELFKHTGQAIGPTFAGAIASIWSLNTSFVAASGIAGLILVVSLLDF